MNRSVNSETGFPHNNKHPSVAVVILNWNGRGYLERFLPFLIASAYGNKRIVVADNASTDGSVDFIKKQFPSVEILINPSNEGFAKGYNTALKQIESDYYILLNSDVEVAPGWIEPVISLMQNDPLIAACQPKILSLSERHKFEYAGASGGWIDSYGYPFSRGRVFDVVEEDNGQYDDVQPCFWASGAALFIRAKLFHEMNGFDGYFFAHQEEIDLCWRLQLAGYKVYVQPASVVYHIGGGTLPHENSMKVFLNFRNNLIMLAKNLPIAEAVWKLPVRIALDAVAAWKGLLTGSAGYFVAIVKAHFHFFRWLLLHRKQSVFPVIKKPAPLGRYDGLVIVDYFIRKKRRFSEIVGSK